MGAHIPLNYNIDTFNHTDVNGIWELWFDAALEIKKIIILNRGDGLYHERLNGAIMYLFDENNVIFNQYVLSSAIEQVFTF